MMTDETRHFRGCPLREKYPTHEAEKQHADMLEEAWGIIANVDNGDWKQSAEWLAAAKRWRDRWHEILHAKGRPTSELWPALPSNAWASKEAAPPGAVELKHEPSTVFEHDLQMHRARIDNFWKHPPESMTYATKEDVLSDAVRFLLAVAHQPEPNLEKRVESLEKLEPMLHDWNIFKRVEELEAKMGLICSASFFDRIKALEATPIQMQLKMPPGPTPIEQAFGKHTSRPRIVCLCGSTRFAQVFALANLEETLKHHIVLTVGSMTHADDGIEACVRCKTTVNSAPCWKGYSMHQFEKLTSNWHADTKKALDALHKKKIELADEIYVLNAMACPKCKKPLRGVQDVYAPLCGSRHSFDGQDRCTFAPYIGDSTRSEIAHALALGKPIRFLYPQGPENTEALTSGGQPYGYGDVPTMMRRLGLEAK